MNKQKRERSATASSAAKSSKSKSSEVKPAPKRTKNLSPSQLNSLMDLFGSINLGTMAVPAPAPAPAASKKKTKTKPELSEFDKLALAFGQIGMDEKKPRNQRSQQKARPIAVPVRTSRRTKTKVLPEIKLDNPSDKTILLIHTVKTLDHRSGEMNALDDMLSQIITKLEKKEKYNTLEKLLKQVHRDVIAFIDSDDVTKRETLRTNLNERPNAYREQIERVTELMRQAKSTVRKEKYERIAEELGKLENIYVPRFRELDALITRIDEKRTRIKQLVQQVQQDEVFDLFNQFGL